jgi:hypothetical protein
MEIHNERKKSFPSFRSQLRRRRTKIHVYLVGKSVSNSVYQVNSIAHMELESLADLLPQERKPRSIKEPSETKKFARKFKGSHEALDIYQQILEKCYRMNLTQDMLLVENMADYSATKMSTLREQMDNTIANAIIPGIQKILDKGLFEMYQVLYTIDVEERFIKDKIMEVENITLIPSIIAFAIIDRLKARYTQYQMLAQPTP